MGEVPQPASLEYTLRAMPVRMMALTDAPAKPPIMAVPVKASRKICTMAAGTRVMFTTIITMPISRYRMLMNGTSRENFWAMPLVPPVVIR